MRNVVVCCYTPSTRIGDDEAHHALPFAVAAKLGINLAEARYATWHMAAIQEFCGHMAKLQLGQESSLLSQEEFAERYLAYKAEIGRSAQVFAVELSDTSDMHACASDTMSEMTVIEAKPTDRLFDGSEALDYTAHLNNFITAFQHALTDEKFVEFNKAVAANINSFCDDFPTTCAIREGDAIAAAYSRTIALANAVISKFPSDLGDEEAVELAQALHSKIQVYCHDQKNCYLDLIKTFANAVQSFAKDKGKLAAVTTARQLKYTLAELFGRAAFITYELKVTQAPRQAQLYRFRGTKDARNAFRITIYKPGPHRLENDHDFLCRIYSDHLEKNDACKDIEAPDQLNTDHVMSIAVRDHITCIFFCGKAIMIKDTDDPLFATIRGMRDTISRGAHQKQINCSKPDIRSENVYHLLSAVISRIQAAPPIRATLDGLKGKQSIVVDSATVDDDATSIGSRSTAMSASSDDGDGEGSSNASDQGEPGSEDANSRKLELEESRKAFEVERTALIAAQDRRIKKQAAELEELKQREAVLLAQLGAACPPRLGKLIDPTSICTVPFFDRDGSANPMARAISATAASPSITAH